ncbi:outer membrane factor, OMF family [Chitinophaga costaii]|uniref:Outer membrane factor, OMF family n=1 Tax=Chitinophaga costaii TaxID=1335309 RepID=A0A1C4EGD0_9BACT|nr:TolC family protein [Chitinophaga costaii]PUZ23841.1 TolC family protein [Chitinophaga costaii]SCC42625.1 outer membrane factor, OMF family [Chitinophaga costaii]
MRRMIILWLLVFNSVGACAQEQLTFTSLDDVLAYAEAHSSTYRNATQQALLTKYQTLAAQLSKWNLKADANFTATDNTKLPVNFLPAQIFGGQEGTFRAITLGQQYVSMVSTSPQFDLLNPYAMAMVKVSRANEQLTRISNQLSKKSLCESMAAAYYNILSYAWQGAALRQSLVNADSLTQIMQRKQAEGIARTQDVNNALATQLSVKDHLQQLEIQMEQETNNLKLLCDIPSATQLTITTAQPAPAFEANLAASNNLLQQQYLWQQKYRKADLEANKKWFLPTLTFISNVGWSQYSNSRFFDRTAWPGTNYVGLKLSLPLAPDITKAATVRYDRIYMQINDNNIQHSALQDSISNRQVVLDYRKAFTSYELSARIESLKKDAYQKNLDIYQEGILSATDLLLSFNDWLNSSINTVTQLAASEYDRSRININNTFK